MRVHFTGTTVFKNEKELVKIYDEFRKIGYSSTASAYVNAPDNGDSGAKFRKHNLDCIKAADVVVIDVTPYLGITMYSGCALELGYAVALNKTIYLYTTQRNREGYVLSLFNRVREEQSMLMTRDKNGNYLDENELKVESYGYLDSFMVDLSCKEAFNSFEEVLERLEYDIKKNKKQKYEEIPF